jgi:GrpB-like predicted nucleotidyltransferase (UPF0157 family)
MGTIRIRPADDIQQAARAAYAEHRARIAEVLPNAEIEHVGATSVPGALTKGDVDLLVRVEPGLFGPFRDALIRDPALLEEYNALKLRLDGENYDRYTEEKGAFVERVLLRLSRSAP